MSIRRSTVGASNSAGRLLSTILALLFLMTAGGRSPSAQALPGELIVSSFLSGAVLRYSGETGGVIDIFAQADALVGPGGLAFGSDGALYVVGQGSHNVVRFDAVTGEFIDEFVAAGSGGLSFPTGLIIGPDGHLYVASLGTHQVLRYRGDTGEFIDAFVAAESGGLESPAGLTFGPDGHFYVAGSRSDNVLRYDGATGAFIDVFAAGGGLSSPAGIVFGPDGHLYVASSGTDSVLRYHGSTGASLGEFVSASSGGLDDPIGLVFGSDGNLYVASGFTNRVLRYSGTTGAFIDAFVTAGAEGLNFPSFLAFRPIPNVVFFSAGGNTRAALAFGDFNGDGFADLAMGSFEQNVGAVSKAGAVTVVYGTADGLRSTGSQTWHQESPGVSLVNVSGDQFGRSLAAGDFDGDGNDDLAIGIPGEGFVFAQHSGAVVVLYGSARVSDTSPGGLQTTIARGSPRWNQFRLTGSGSDESDDRFGAALVAGNFNGDVNSLTGFPMDDLAIGVPGEDDAAGEVRVVYGSRLGLSATGADAWSQDAPGIEGNYEGDDRFGAALTAGNFNGDRNPQSGLGFDDLAVGAPGEDTGIFFGADAGAVNVIIGSIRGLTSDGNLIFTQDTFGLDEDADRDDEFGSALASADFDADGHDDLAIGVPSEDYGFFTGPLTARSRVDRGRVHVVYSDEDGLNPFISQLLSEDDFLVSLENRGALFGQALAAGDFDGDGFADLAMGLPGSDHNSVHVLFGSANRLTGAGVEKWDQQSGHLQGSFEEGDRFGSALAAADAGDPRGITSTRFADLAIFAQDGDFGAANVVYGTASGLAADGNQQWFCGEDGVGGVNERITAGSLFDVVIDGRFSNEPGQGEWSDVTPGAFVSDPANSQQVVRAIESDNTAANSLLFAALALGPGGSTGTTSKLSAMFAFLPRTNTVVQPGQVVAAITFPITLDAAGTTRPVTLRVRAPTLTGMSLNAVISATASQFEAVIDLDDDGVEDVRAQDLGIEAAADFGASPLSDVPHLVVELRLPLAIPAGFAPPGGPLPPSGVDGLYGPAPAFWTASFARDDQPAGILSPASGALIHIHPDGVTAVDAGVVPEKSVAVNVKPDERVNAINLRSQATVPVAVLTTPAFDATSVSSESFEWRDPLDLSRAAHHYRVTEADVDRDGDQDRVFFFRVPDLLAAGVLNCHSSAAAFVGRTSNNQTIAGADVLIVKCGGNSP